MTQELQLALLGNLQISLDGVLLSGLDTNKAKALLCFLAVSGRPHARQSLIGLLWGNMPEIEAKANLRVTLANLRRLLGDHLLITRDTVAFNRESAYQLDVELFEAKYQATQPEADLRLWREAVELYRGELLEGFYVRDAPDFEEWVLGQRERLRELALQALYTLAAHHTARGEYAAGIDYTTRLLALDPWREEAHCQLMLLLARSGQRSAALAQYETCRRIIAAELGLEPGPETKALYERLKAAEASSPHNLPPQPTPFIGRETELAELSSRLNDSACRLLTLVGPGGVGKSRLALQAAAKTLDSFLHGVYFVSLTAVSSSEFVVPTLADALKFTFYGGEEPRTQLLNHLRHKEMLLILDNFEHLLASTKEGEGGGIELLTQILAAAPDVKLLVTSRERLNLQGEWLFEVQGLPFPQLPADALSDQKHLTEKVESYSAVQLFVQSAGRIQADFSLTEAEKLAVARICDLVAGLPLGIELAAAWVRLLSCAEIAQEIERNLNFLATSVRDVPERHRSLRAVFAHSWNLLSAAEQQVFKQLSVFRGGFRREAAERLTGANLPVLAALVDKSFLRRSASGRYEIHELLRQYAAEKLAASPPEQEQTQDLHCDYYLNFLAQREAQLTGEKQKETLAEISAEIENARAGWRWAVAQGQIAPLEKAAEGLYLFYDLRSRFQEGNEAFRQTANLWINEAKIALIFSSEQKKLLRGKILNYQGWFCYRLGDYDQAKTLFLQSLHIFQQLETQEYIAIALSNLGKVAVYLGEYTEAKELSQKSLILMRATGDQKRMIGALTNLGNVAFVEGEYNEAKQYLQECLDLAKARGDRHSAALSLNNLGLVINTMGQHAEAKQYHQEALTISQEIGDQFVAALSLINLGSAAYYLNEHLEARLYFQQSLNICRETGDRRGLALSFYHLGLAAEKLGEYLEAKRQYEAGLTIFREIGDRRGIMNVLDCLGSTTLALGEAAYPQAEQYFHQALKIGLDIQEIPRLVGITIEFAALLKARGEKEEALLLLGLAGNYPAINQSSQDKAEQLLAELENELPPEVTAVAREKAQAMSLETVVAAIVGHKELLQ
ncbi:MAG: tetratricopeptide repeat protein [Anaerolineae bacterium]